MCFFFFNPQIIIKMSLTKKEIDELKPIISAVVKSVMGFSEPTLITAAINCLDNGFSKQKTAGRDVFYGKYCKEIQYESELLINIHVIYLYLPDESGDTMV